MYANSFVNAQSATLAPLMSSSSNDGDVDIRPWIPSKYLQKGGTTVLIGKRRSGKSTTILNIMYHMQNVFEFGFIFCGSASTREQYSRHVPHDFISDTMSLDLINKLMNFQDRRRSLKTIRPIFIIIDDFAFNRSVLRSSTMYKLFANGRHYQIFFILGMQYSLSIGPDARGNIDTLILHRDVTVQNQQKLYDNYNISFKNFEEFRGVLLDVTRQHRVLVFQKDLECVDDFPIFHWKAKHPIPCFKVSPHLQWWKTGKAVLLSAIDTVLSGTLMRDPRQDGKYLLTYANKHNKRNQTNNAALLQQKRNNNNLFVCRPDTKRNIRDRTRTFNVIAPKMIATKQHTNSLHNAKPTASRMHSMRRLIPTHKKHRHDQHAAHDHKQKTGQKSVSLQYVAPHRSAKTPKTFSHQATFMQPIRKAQVAQRGTANTSSVPARKKAHVFNRGAKKQRGMAAFFLGV